MNGSGSGVCKTEERFQSLWKSVFVLIGNQIERFLVPEQRPKDTDIFTVLALRHSDRVIYSNVLVK